MAFTAQSVIDLARRRVLDGVTPYRFDDAYYLDGINEGMTVMMGMNKPLFTERRTFALVPGVAQTIPEATEMLIRLTRNRGLTGDESGAAIRTIDGINMDVSRREWPTVAFSNDVEYFFASEHSPREFWVFPGQPATASQVEAEVVVHPGRVTAVTDTVPNIRDQYLSALGNFTAAFVLMTDDEDPTTTAKADRLFKSFMALVDTIETGGSPVG